MPHALLLSRADVEPLLAPDVCIEAIEDAFRRLAEGAVPPPAILAMHAEGGSFHVKAGLLAMDRPYFAARINANFPQNGARHGLPTIQGAVLLFDAGNGRPLAVMDSIAITALRTAATSAVAAKYLAAKRCNAAPQGRARAGRRGYRLRLDRHRASGRRRGGRGLLPGARGKGRARLQPRSGSGRGVSTYPLKMRQT